MRPVLASALAALMLQGAHASEQTPEERGSAAAGSVRGVFGSEQGLVANGIEPFSAERPMRTVDGQAFEASLACEATRQFLRVTMIPQGSDIGRVVVEMDTNLDGATDRAVNFTGPFAGLCGNGLIRCAPGSWEDCHFLQWDTDGGVLGLREVAQQRMGACYCFNASCGNNLLVVNSEKVVGDLGASVLTAAAQLLPRVSATRAVSDALSVRFVGQRAGCGIDASPEQFFRHPDNMAAAGAAAMSVPGSVANFVSGTAEARNRGIASIRCEINRNVATNEIRKSDILNFLSTTRGNYQDCGPGCMRFLIGEVRENFYDGNTCTVFEEDLRLQVLRPERIQSIRLTRIGWNDQVQLLVDGTRYYNSYPDWEEGDFPPRFRIGMSCNWGDDHDRNVNISLLPGFGTMGLKTVRLRTAVGNTGQGFAFIEARVAEACELAPEQIVDGCAATAANPRCRLRNEWVDGVQTVASYLTTGLGPLPTSRTVGNSCRLDTGNRSWWRTEREYDCDTGQPRLDLSADAERYESIHQSIDLSSGAFTDHLRSADGTTQSVASSIPVLAERGSDACTPTCRTRRPRPGSSVGTAGPTTALNVTGVAYDFTFRDCEGGTCPVEPGEEVVGACDCHNNFAQAVSMMQTIRMVAEDTSCEAPQ
jgi:hypothetical protein